MSKQNCLYFGLNNAINGDFYWYLISSVYTKYLENNALSLKKLPKIATLPPLDRILAATKVAIVSATGKSNLYC